MAWPIKKVENINKTTDIGAANKMMEDTNKSTDILNKVI